MSAPMPVTADDALTCALLNELRSVQARLQRHLKTKTVTEAVRLAVKVEKRYEVKR